MAKKCWSGSSPFTFMDIFLTFLSIGSFLADIGTDIMVIYEYFKKGHTIWMFLTLSLVCIPSLIVQIFSVRWYIVDGLISNHVWIAHVLQLGIFYRYIQLFQLGVKANKSKSLTDLQNFHQQQSDICMLRLFESFTESAPQLVLQLYIMVSTDEWNPWTGVSALASVFSLSWGISAYSKAMRTVHPEKNHLSWWGLLFQAMWRIGMVSSRIIAMVLFAAAYGYWLFIIMLVHWLIMTIWVCIQKTDFCTTWWEERLYNCVVGVIYCFCYFNVKEGKSRFRMIFYYSVTVLQNITSLYVFYVTDTELQTTKYIITLLVPIGIITGLTSLLLYYRFFHPSGPITLFDVNKIQEDQTSKNKEETTCSTLKTCRKMMTTSHSEDYMSEASNKELGTEILNNSILSAESNNVLCTSDLHRSHSLNCSLGSHVMRSRYHALHNISSGVLANHYSTVNYKFRQAVAFGLLTSKIHCSCLILTRESDVVGKDLFLTSALKISKSLPNLDFNIGSNGLQGDEQSLTSLTSIASNVDYKENNQYHQLISVCSDNSNTDHLPQIIKDHIIRIKVGTDMDEN